ncbi:Patched family protein [Dirofilaria immitis]|nr:Patched family protein [Dirofilaria immitis]
MGTIEALETMIVKSFRNLGTYIGRKPTQVIIVMLMMSSLMSLGILRLGEVNNVRTEYSPNNAPSRIEHAVAMNFLGQNGTLDPVYILIKARDAGSLLRDEYRKALIQYISYIQSNITIQFSIKELCEPYCELNSAFIAFLKLYDPNNQITYTCPSIDLFGSLIFIGNNAYGVVLEEGSNLIKSFSTAIINLFISAQEDEILSEWQLEIQRQCKGKNFELLDLGIASDCLVSLEVRRMGLETAPVLFGSVSAMIFFVVISSFRNTVFVWTPISINCHRDIFLVLTVGVDDIFIILRAWDRTNTVVSVPERLMKTLENAGPSITISSLTNALSFGIGIFSSTPALILFTAVLALSGKREQSNYQALFCCFKADSSARNQFTEKMSHLQIWIIKSWSSVITAWYVRALLVLILVLYYYISYLGILKTEIKISVDKMVLPDSYLHDFQFLLDNVLRNMQPITVFVMNPGDLRDPDRLNGIKSLVLEYEHSLFSYGNESTVFWLQQYEKFSSFYSESEDFTYIDVPAFLKSTTYFSLNSFIHMNESACNDNQPECISSFFFITNFHGVCDLIKINDFVSDLSQTVVIVDEVVNKAFTKINITCTLERFGT